MVVTVAMGGDKRQVQDLKVSLDFTPGWILSGLQLSDAGFGFSIRHVQISLSSFVIEDIWLLIITKLTVTPLIV